MDRFVFRIDGAGTVILDGDNSYSFPVVGESHYQDALESICGGCTEDGVHHECVAVFAYDNDNPYDSNAVAVFVDGQLVGYVPRNLAPEFRSQMRDLNPQGAAVGCRALVKGGWDRGGGDIGSFGISLDVSMPYRIISPDA